MIKLIIGVGEVLAFLLICAFCGYIIYALWRLYDKMRIRKMVNKLTQSNKEK